MNQIILCRAIFYEHDNLPKDEQKQLWQKLGLPEPTFQVDTGGKSIHSYWVFEKPSSVEVWKTLQTDLLEYSDGDRSIKNPSRVMRLPGFAHQKSGNVTEIISQCGKRYSYEQLRRAIPTQQPQTLDFSQPKATHLDAVPLENCLSKDDRHLINSGEGQGKRNDAGAKLARNLIGTAKRLDYLGCPYTGEPRQLFDNYCSYCTPPLDSKEAGQIWESAEKSNPTATLSDEYIENCVKAWQRQNRQPEQKSKATPPKSTNTSNAANLPEKWDDTKVQEKIVELAKERPKKHKLTGELKKISRFSRWQLKELRDYYHEIVTELDQESELEDDLLEFEEILNSNEPLPCNKILPKELYPILKYADNLGVNHEPVLLVLEATVASLIDSETKIVGRRCSDYKEVPTMFSAIVGEPGAKKSPIIRAITTNPLLSMEKEAEKRYDSEFADYERDLAEWEDADKQSRGDKPTPPKRRQFFTGDYTPEALRDIAQDNPKILRVFDELAREANSRGRYTNGKGGETQQLLESYGGFLPAMNRKGKHYSSVSVNQCLLGGIQPDILSKIMSSSDQNGEFARYNVATLVKKPHLWNGDSEVSLNITDLLVGIYKAIDELPGQEFYLDKDAYKLFEDCHNKAESKASEETKPALVYQYTKADGKILRWALLYHILEAVAKGETPSKTIGKRPMQIARYRMRYQTNQVRAILARMEKTEPSKLMQVYQLALKKGEPITPRDVRRAGHSDGQDEAIAIFRRLEEMGYGEVKKTSQTFKFSAFEVKTEAKVAQDVTRWQETTDALSNKANQSITPTPGEKGVTKISVDSKALTAMDTPQRWQDVTTPSSNLEDNRGTEVNYYKDARDSEGDTRRHKASDTLSNDVESSIAPTLGEKGVTKISVDSKSDRVIDTPERWQDVTTPSSNFEETENLPKSINDFIVGQKVQVDDISLYFVIKAIDKKKGILRDEDDTGFRWQRCRVVND